MLSSIFGKSAIVRSRTLCLLKTMEPSVKLISTVADSSNTASNGNNVDSEVVSNPIEKAMSVKISKLWAPVQFLEIVNESYKHNVPKGSESHFKITVVSDVFDGKSPIQRHRLVNHALSEELKGSINALSISAKTTAQWTASNGTTHETPNCLGGSKRW